MSDTITPWIAGLLEGEGCFGFAGKYPRITCGMTDRDVIDKLHVLAGGRVHVQPPRPTRPNTKEMYVWGIYSRAELVQLLIRIEQYMGLRRQAKIRELLDHIASNPLREVGPVHGTKNTYSYYKCRCTLCRKAVADYARNLRQTKTV